MTLVKSINNYIPYNEQETQDKLLLLDLLNKEDDLFMRSNTAHHFTASAWVINKSRDKVLMVHHNIYNSWSWLGGHADGDEDLFHVAKKEVLEESGLTSIEPFSDDIFSIEVLTVDGHIKHGSYVSSHLHLNVTYLFIANEKDDLFVRPEENSDVSWFSLEEAVEASTEPWFKTNIYTKLNEKLKKQ